MQGLQHKRVLIVGAGGLGSPVAIILAQSGVGELHVADDDRVEVTNLHRQLLFTENEVGHSKAQRAAERIEHEARAHGHAHVRAVAREMRVRPDLALSLVSEFDLVIEGSDNFATKFLIADACALASVPCVQAGAVRWVGWALASIPGASACLRCVFEDIPNAPAEGCGEAGVIGPVVGVIGAVQAALALRLLLGDPSAASQLYNYRALQGSLRSSHVTRSRACRLCSGQIRDLNASNYLPRECAA
jgi:molybdopterin/thiamine biosynthesis adenylyltransferase